MKRNLIRPLIGIVLIVLMGSYIVPVGAQATAEPCNIDLSQASALMTQAQAKASSGDTAGALALLDDATKAISDIKAGCSAAVVPELTATYKEPNGIYTMSFPEGWVTTALPGNSGSESPEKPILFASDSAVFKALTDNKPIGKSQGVVVYVGTAKQVAMSVGAFKSDANYDAMTSAKLIATIIVAQTSSSTSFGEIEKLDPINDHEAAQTTVAFNDSKGGQAIVKGNLIIIQYSKAQFALLLSLASPDQPDSATAIALAMAKSLKPA